MSYASEALHARRKMESANASRPDIVVETEEERRLSNEAVPFVHGQHYGQMKRRRALVTMKGYRYGRWDGWFW